MKATVTIMLIVIIVLSSVLCVSATISNTSGHEAYYSLNHIDDNYPSSEINLTNTYSNTDYYSGGEWSLTFSANT